MERNTPDGICTWLSEEFNRPGWHSTRVAQELSNEVLDMVLMRYDHYHQSAKLGVLFALLYVRKNDLLRMKWTMQKFFDRATQDTDDWVQMTAHILQGVPMERKLDMNVETWSDSFGTLLNDIGNGVKQNGISFHANEYAVMIDEAREDCIYGTEVYNANKPTLKQHFALKTPPQQTTRAKHRKQALQALVDKERAEMVLPISPTTPSNMNTTAGVTRSLPISSMNGGPAPKRQAIAPPSQNLFIGRGNQRRPPPPSRPMAPGANSLFNTRPNTRPIPTSAPGASSMFIPSRKGSFGAVRPAPVRPVIPIPSSSSAAPSNNPPTPTTPKGFQKQSRVQMLDFTESSQMLQDNNRKIDEAEQRLKDQQEQQKQENALRRQQQREEAAKWKKTNAKPVKRQRTSSVSTSRESSDPPSSPTQNSTTPPSNPSSPTLTSPINDNTNDENYLQEQTSTFNGNPSMTV